MSRVRSPPPAPTVRPLVAAAPAGDVGGAWPARLAPVPRGPGTPSEGRSCAVRASAPAVLLALAKPAGSLPIRSGRGSAPCCAAGAGPVPLWSQDRLMVATGTWLLSRDLSPGGRPTGCSRQSLQCLAAPSFRMVGLGTARPPRNWGVLPAAKGARALATARARQERARMPRFRT